jgi:hypothetical protein
MISGDDLVDWGKLVQNKAIQANNNVHDMVERRSCTDNTHVLRRMCPKRRLN